MGLHTTFTRKLVGEEQELKDTDIDEAASKKERNTIDPVIIERGYPPYSPELNPIEQS
ncbi:hypothetical protein HMPREF1544_05467 [Mucor circinelloides 1006PhL]|uniref:Tc1-like transposase DDE domain-containing protein n=1 Tax=Mucor circinelloides f. circinelloides (strain 1006PhL) TaxID=1220926 RepID=S2JBR9_MUCC1|nr:hypothetical protein HMPREF1544_05467 [Mucor circinelloides 1006PhL]